MTDFTMISEDDRHEAMAAANTLYENLLRFDYMSPDSYRDLFKDDKAREIFVRLANMLDHVRDTYAK